MLEIIEDKDSEMLQINNEGNYWDFNRDGESLRDFLSELGMGVKLSQKPYSEWYE